MADWLTIRNDYINGGGSYRKMAEKYGVTFGAVRTRAEREGWPRLKEEQLHELCIRTAQETREKIAEATSNVAAEEAATKARIRAKLFKLAEDWVNKREEIGEDATDFRRIVQCCIDMGVFNEEVIRAGEGREADPLSKALQELAEGLNDADQ